MPLPNSPYNPQVTKRVRPSVPSLPVTERLTPRSAGLDQKSTLEILRIINREDSQVPRAIARTISLIARVVDQVVQEFQKGGPSDSRLGLFKRPHGRARCRRSAAALRHPR